MRLRIPLTGSFKPEDPGWQLERIGNNAPRGMVIEGATPDKIRLIGHPCTFGFDVSETMILKHSMSAVQTSVLL